jgi:hypothetical protein
MVISRTKWSAVAQAVLLAGCWMGADLEYSEDGGGGGTDGDSAQGTDTYPLPEVADGGLFDPLTNLIWQDPPADDLMGQFEARDYCNGLVHGGRDDWYLPDVNQLRSLLRDCGDGCPVRDPACLSGDCAFQDSCQGCPPLEGPGTEGCYWAGWLAGWCHKYWSCSPLSMAYSSFWLVDYRNGEIGFLEQMWTSAVRCVRDPS